MSKSSGFCFRRLEVRGRNKKPATLTLKKGLNVVSGASDTGKSYLVQCLDFMTGATTSPEPIDEAKGYETIFLEIETWTGNTYTLERSLKGGDFLLYRAPISDIESDTEHELLKERQRTKKLRSVSDFYLNLCELSDVTLLAKKTANEKWDLKFRAVAHLVIIDEERIYTRNSPVHAGTIITQKTLEESLFRYLITGSDDSSLISAPKESQGDSDQRIRREMVLSMIESTEADISALTVDPDEIESQLQRLQHSLDEITTALSLDHDELRERQQQRRDLLQTAEETSARLEVLNRLTNRFHLLEKYYESDLRRLGAMLEAGEYLSQIPISECPMCGTEDPWSDGESIELLEVACEREVERIQLLRGDLSSTMKDSEEEKRALTREMDRARRSYGRVGDEIEQQLLPSTEVRKAELNELLHSQRKLDRASMLKHQLDRMHEQLAELEGTSTPRSSARQVSEGNRPKTSEASDFCKVVEKLLKEWKFPDSGRVSFSESKQDIVINGKDRSSHGKGIRALSHAAFIVGLLRYCRLEERPYTGFVVLDSPLVAYREPDSKKSVEESGVKESFYRSLARKKARQQIVVFENEDPPTDILSKMHYVHFSGDKGDDTRAGFFP